MITKIKLLLVALLLLSFQCNTRQIFDANGVLAFDVKNDTSAIYYSLSGEKYLIGRFPSDVYGSICFDGQPSALQEDINIFFRKEIESRIGDIGCYQSGWFYCVIMFDSDLRIKEIRPLYSIANEIITGAVGKEKIANLIVDIIKATNSKWSLIKSVEQDYYVQIIKFRLL